jgi:hypothetical protein
MLTHTTKVHVAGLTGRQITDFLIEAGDDAYRRWWPGTHLEFHNLRRVPGAVGNLVYFDEFVGRRRLRMKAVVTEVAPGRRLVWQLMRGIRLPAWLVLEVEDDDDGVTITHSIRAGFDGAARVLDPVVALYLSREFRRAMDQHVRTEFQRLARLLNDQRVAGSRSKACDPCSLASSP